MMGCRKKSYVNGSGSLRVCHFDLPWVAYFDLCFMWLSYLSRPRGCGSTKECNLSDVGDHL